MNILVTGGCGFIGSNYIQYILKCQENITIINIDSLTYAGNTKNLSTVIDDPRYQFRKGDIRDKKFLKSIFEQFKIDYIIHFAAESHVDRSILDIQPFVETNIIGTMNLLDCCVSKVIKKFIYISTDEVYGSIAGKDKFTEKSLIHPNNPYSATKASAEMLVNAYYKTHQINMNILRSTNNFGPQQHIEKLIPKMITNLTSGKHIPIYGNGENIRDWLYVEDFCSAIHLVIQKGIPGEIYNVSSNQELSNNELVEQICKYMNVEKNIRYIKDRKGHDFRYALSAEKIHFTLGWSPNYSFEQGILNTIQWYEDNSFL
ncbi:dTDP-glucose 4,6-dehydratase [Enterococcus sp. AZ194]|uniref:dTDP-glucose 4,6-dehydratase n=1 Tax=Enterococcus sp. AZ194 TaxID=2774629 RepID=UPI003F27F1E8